jgi:hypothetical protein
MSEITTCPYKQVHIQPTYQIYAGLPFSFLYSHNMGGNRRA